MRISSALYFAVALIAAVARADHIDIIIDTARDREAIQCADSYVEWKVEERVQRESLAIPGIPSVPRVAPTPTGEFTLRRVHRLVLAEHAWRIDVNGEMFTQPPGHQEIGVWPVESTCIFGGDQYRRYHRNIEQQLVGNGQVSAKLRQGSPGWINDAGCLPVTLFARPSSTIVFNRIVSGEFAAQPAQLGADSGLLCLADAKRNICRIWYDRVHGLVPVRMQFNAGLNELQITYKEFEGFGVAPSDWTYVKRTTSGDVVQLLSATVTEWHKRKKEITPLVADYEFPKECVVLDLDTMRPFAPDSDQRKVRIVTTIIGATVVLAFLFILRRRRRVVNK